MNPNQHDSFLQTADWLQERDLPAALILVETLEPAGGKETVIFPPTYARRGGEHPYTITTVRTDLPPEAAAEKGHEANVCDLDSVGSQANRMEPAFRSAPGNPLADLVPQVTIQAVKPAKEATLTTPAEAAGFVQASLLDASHRIADGAVRFAEGLADKADAAIHALRLDGNAGPLAKLAPTSLVFGFWDSRASQYKFPRLVSSTIRATNVSPLKRSAQFDPVLDPLEIGLKGAPAPGQPADADAAAEPAAAKSGEGDAKLSEFGLDSAPAVDSHGGVRVYGKIVRRTEINLVALRALAVVRDGEVDEEKSLTLRRYLLGLALVAARFQTAYNLRAGCLLVGAADTPPEARLVRPDGRREEFAWEFEAAFDFARAAAEAFGVEAQNEPFKFQTENVREALKGKAAAKAAKAAKKAK